MSTPTVDQLVAFAEVELLSDAGVTDWEWYEESIESYYESADAYEDAENLMDALRSGGVDNWIGYDDSIEGLSDYADYLEDLEDLTAALSFWDWRKQVNSQKVEVAVVETVPEAPAAVLSVPEGETEERLLEYISQRYGASEAAVVFDNVKKNGFWKRTTFPKQYDKAMKTLVEGTTLETPRKALFEAVVKSKAIDAALDQLKEKKA